MRMMRIVCIAHPTIPLPPMRLSHIAIQCVAITYTIYGKFPSTLIGLYHAAI